MRRIGAGARTRLGIQLLPPGFQIPCLLLCRLLLCSFSCQHFYLLYWTHKEFFSGLVRIGGCVHVWGALAPNGGLSLSPEQLTLCVLYQTCFTCNELGVLAIQRMHAVTTLCLCRRVTKPLLLSEASLRSSCIGEYVCHFCAYSSTPVYSISSPPPLPPPPISVLLLTLPRSLDLCCFTAVDSQVCCCSPSHSQPLSCWPSRPVERRQREPMCGNC